MKSIIFCIAFMFGIADMAFAGFTTKKVLPATTAQQTVQTGSEQAATQHTGFFARLKSRALTKIMQFDQHYGGGFSHGEGSRAIFWALWGILIPPLGILAIYHGINGLNSRNGLERDRATLGIIVGIIEVIATIAFIFWFFAYTPVVFI